MPDVPGLCRQVEFATHYRVYEVAVTPLRHALPITSQFRSYPQFTEVFDLEVRRHVARNEAITDARLDDLLNELSARDHQGRFLAVAIMLVIMIEQAPACGARTSTPPRDLRPTRERSGDSRFSQTPTFDERFRWLGPSDGAAMVRFVKVEHCGQR